MLSAGSADCLDYGLYCRMVGLTIITQFDVCKTDSSLNLKVTVMTTKLVKFLFFFSAFSIFFFLETSQRIHRVRNMKCSSSNNSIAPDFKCYAKSYSRTLSTVNANLTFVRPLFEAKVVWICVILERAKLINFVFF
jgi:hypothetical protein